MLEIPMTKNTEGAAGDLTADLAALRQDVARLAETASELVQLIAVGIGVLIGRMNRWRG
jgi:hypothetical protein